MSDGKITWRIVSDRPTAVGPAHVEQVLGHVAHALGDVDDHEGHGRQHTVTTGAMVPKPNHMAAISAHTSDGIASPTTTKSCRNHSARLRQPHQQPDRDPDRERDHQAQTEPLEARREGLVDGLRRERVAAESRPT